jgi:hypothetical protein
MYLLSRDTEMQTVCKSVTRYKGRKNVLQFTENRKDSIKSAIISVHKVFVIDSTHTAGRSMSVIKFKTS